MAIAPEPTYLGDGVYASYREQGNVLVLTTEHHDENSPSCRNVIYIEPIVKDALIAYIHRITHYKQNKSYDT